MNQRLLEALAEQQRVRKARGLKMDEREFAEREAEIRRVSRSEGEYRARMEQMWSAQRGFVNLNVPPEMYTYRGQVAGYSDNMLNAIGDVKWIPEEPKPEESISSQVLAEAKNIIKDITTTLERIKQEPLILYQIDKITKDGKHAFVKKGDTELRIKACDPLERGDEVLLHPKTYQIVENLGKPPLEASRFSPESVPVTTWADIGGLEQAKADMIEAIETPYKYKKLFTHYKQRQIKGILLSGPPGCGKTMLGKAAANAIAKIHAKEGTKTGFLYVKGPEILNMYVGQTEQTIRDMFFDAYRHKEIYGYPAIIFIDEADAILAARGSRLIGIGNTIVPAFLTEMDGLEDSGAIVIIATNRPDTLDPAIVRDGRIDRKVTVTRPDIEQGRQILLMNLARVPVVQGLDREMLAEEWSKSLYHHDRFVRQGVRLNNVINGAMLANCVNIAVSFAMRRDIDQKKMSGVIFEDGIAAINLIQQQAHAVRHDLEVEG